MTTTNLKLQEWVREVADLTKPDKVVWCTGSEEEYASLVATMVGDKSLITLNPDTYPDCYLHRSDPTDVARTEHLTFVCTTSKDDAGQNNNWLAPAEGHARVDKLFAGCMRQRTLYIIPYCMGPIDSPFSRCGVEITDSPYVVINMKIMTRMGRCALQRIERENAFVKGLHSTGDLKLEHRLIMHFPEESTIKSIGSGYGGNALLGKKCHALRIASYQARNEGWLAEHMLIVGVQNPAGEIHYIAAAFPSACGKTNLAMLIPPESYSAKGWKIWTIGDDIAWLHIGEDGKLYAINPEAGFFGVMPGTSLKTNPTALNMLNRNVIFTNVGLTANQEPWWEGKNSEIPVLDWQGRSYDPRNGPAAHPNSRFTVATKQCASYSAESENPHGVPISAIIFGGRRPNLVPLVFEAKSWEHGVLLGASVSSETTAAASGKVGILRRDPMAMLPFCGYNFADYWRHWLSLAQRTPNLPKIFHVNWFRKDQDNSFMWPGFGDNIRVIDWILKRCQGKGDGVQTPIGSIPTPESIDLSGLNVTPVNMRKLCHFDPTGWQKEMQDLDVYLQSYGDRIPAQLLEQVKNVLRDIYAGG